MEQHTIPPIFDQNSKVLVLGTFPSVKSREQQFFYGNPLNRFWRVMAAIFGSALPETAVEKSALLLKNRVALWDVVALCDIEGSYDASIRNAVPNDLRRITEKADIRQVYTNGLTADKLYRKLCLLQTGLDAVCLPSTSPANASYSFERLAEAWQSITALMVD